MPTVTVRQYVVLPLLLLFLSHVSYAQSRRLHRLWATLAQHPQPDVVREQALWALAWEKELPTVRQDSLAHLAAALAAQLRDPAGQLVSRVAAARLQLNANQRAAAQATLQAVLAEARSQRAAGPEILALIQLGRSYWATDKHAWARIYWHQAWTVAQRQPDPYWRVRTALLLGNAGPGYAQGIQWYFTGLRLAEQTDCQSCQAEALGGIGYNYALLGELPLAARYTQQSLRRQRQLRNQDGIRRTLMGLAELQIQQAQYSTAIDTYYQALQLATEPTDSLFIAAGLADSHTALGNYPVAQRYARQGLVLARRLNNHALLATLDAVLARVSLGQGQADSAVYYGRRAWSYHQRSPGPTDINTCQILAKAYAAGGNFAQAYAFQGLAQTYIDTLASDKIRAQADQAQYAYQHERQQRQLAQLARDQALEQLRQQRRVAAGVLLLLLSFGAGAAVLATLRRRQRRRLAALREQIAADLHDEVGGLLTQLALEGAYLRETQPVTPAQGRHLDRVAEVSQQAARQLRDVVWSIDTRQDSMTDLLDHLRDYLHELLGTADLEASFTADPALPALTLPLPVRDALYFVFKEALHNVVKHARAQQVRVALYLAAAQQLELTIEDDGRGLAPVEATTALTRGLRNMSRRAAAAGGNIFFERGALGGLLVRLRLPLK